jgi:hypothetical protein
MASMVKAGFEVLESMTLTSRLLILNLISQGVKAL